MRWTLDRKLILMMVMLSAMLIAVTSLFNAYFEKQLYSAIARKTRGLTRSIQFTIEEMTKRERDGTKLYSFLKENSSEGISEINVIDSALKVVASTNPEKMNKEISEEATQLIFDSEDGRLVTEKDNFYNIIIPVVAKGEHQGYIHMIVDSRDVTSVLDATVRNRMAASGVILFGGVLIAIWLSRRYTKPIKEVVSAARSVSAGDLDINLAVKESDEIGELKESFNQMINRLFELRKLEERLRETEHLSTIGDLSRTVAHEVRNPLNFISLSVDHLMDTSGDTDVKELLQRIKHEIKRLDTLVGNYLAYGKPLKIDPKPVRIIHLIEETLSLVYARAEKVGVEIEKRYRVDDSIEVPIDPELIKTCLFNVFQNSFQAMPEGGRLAIELGLADNDISVSITDTGMGIEEEQAEKVFEPFFTTRKRGLGIGLAMTKRVIQEHGGKVSFQSTKGEGSTIVITLPVREEGKR